MTDSDDNKATRYTIGRDEYFRLLLSKEKLDRMEGGGVDNWEGYDESLYPSYALYDDDISDIEEFERELRRRLYGE